MASASDWISDPTLDKAKVSGSYRSLTVPAAEDEVQSRHSSCQGALAVFPRLPFSTSSKRPESR